MAAWLAYVVWNWTADLARIKTCLLLVSLYRAYMSSRTSFLFDRGCTFKLIFCRAVIENEEENNFGTTPEFRAFVAKKLAEKLDRFVSSSPPPPLFYTWTVVSLSLSFTSFFSWLSAGGGGSMVAIFKVKWLYLKQLHSQINGLLFIVQFMFFVHRWFFVFCQLCFLKRDD